MINIRLFRFFSFFLSISLLVGPLPLSAIAENITISMSDWETGVIRQNSDVSYVYLGAELSNIAEIVSRISDLDDQVNSPLLELKKHIEQGFLFAELDAIAETLEYARSVIQKKCSSHNRAFMNNIVNDFEILINQITNGVLTIDSGAIIRDPHLRTLVINENIDVLGESTFYKHMKTKQGIHTLGKLKVGKKAEFKKNVKIKGTLSVTDLVVASCMDSLCVNTLSVSDLVINGGSCIDSLCVNNLSVVNESISGLLSVNNAIINNALITNLTVTATVLDSIINNLTVNATLSANDAIITNTTVTNFSATSAVLQDLTVANCVANLCVNSFSAVDATIDNLTFGGTLSISDLTLQSLSVTDLAVTNCISELCINALSVVDESIAGTLSVNNAVIQNLTLTGALSFNSLSVVDQTISGTLSVTDEVINGNVKISEFSSAGIVHNDALGNLSSSLIVNADISLTADIVDTKLATISTAGKVANSATTATTTNTLNTIVERDGSGNFSAGTITASLSGNATTATTATNFSGSLVGEVTGTQSATVVTNAVSANTANAIVRRSATGGFSAGTISANDAIINDFINFQDLAGTAFVGLQAPAVVPASYTLTLPSSSPTANQVLQANAITPTDLQWVTEGGSIVPAASNTIYVAKYGNDSTGNGSFDEPYLTLTKAISVANNIASLATPVAILMLSGMYVEDNSEGPLAITAAGISLVGNSASSVLIEPSTPANNLLSINSTTRVANVTFQSSTPLATGVLLTAGNLTVFSDVRFFNFLIGVSCAGGGSNSYGFNTCLFVQNGTAISINNTFVECNNCTIFGATSVVGPAANSGVMVTGSGARLLSNGGVCGLCITGFNITGNATVTISNVGFRFNTFDIMQNGASRMTLSACTFELTNGTSDIDVQISDAGTTAELISCEFSGSSIVGSPEGIALAITNNASVNISGGSIHNYTTGLQIGASSDTSSTSLATSGLIIHDCSTDILQQGSATLMFNASTASDNKISINNSANVELAFFDLNAGGSLTIGSTADQNTTLVQAAIASSNYPQIEYQSSLYLTQAVGLENPSLNPTSWFIASQENADFTALTTDRTKIAGIQLYSDEGSPFGGTTALRGWNINKNSSAAALSFTYQNSDIIGQSVVSPYVVMQIDGVNNQLQLPAIGTQIVFDGDTNLYRSSANVLQTDDNFIVGTLTPGRAIVTDAVTNELVSSAVTSTELSFLSGVTSSVQTQLNSKVNKAGDIMTGTLQLPAGTAAAPSLVFTGSTTTGLSAPVANSLSFSTNGTEQMKIGSTGIITIDGFAGTAGVVHNDASGNLSSSLIVDADITNATISNAKLATISSTDTPGSIVVRDGSGNFVTNMISIDGTTTNATDVATKSYVDSTISTGLIAKTPALVVSISNVVLSGLQTIDGVTLNAGDRVLLVGQTNPIENGLWSAAAGAWTRPADFADGSTVGQAYVLVTSGTVGAGSSYLANTPTAVVGTNAIEFALFSLPDTTTGANVGAGTGQVFRNKTSNTLNFRTLIGGTHVTITNNSNDITFTTDATNSNTPNTIVARDASGNFAAGTITANLTGSASNNVLKAGDTMTGALQLPAGTVLAPSLIFTGSTTTGLSSPIANSLSLSTNALERIAISAAGIISVDAFTTAGVVHNDASGNLSSSLIVNADVDPAAAIADSKLATISTIGKVANSATTATSIDTPNTIVLRDGSGNFSANTIVANLTGSASNNVLKAGDTMTGALQLPAGTTALPSLVFTGSTTTGLSTNVGALSFSTSALERLKISSGGIISVDAFTNAGVVHNDASGNLSSSLIVNADVDPAAAIVDTKLATISTVGKVANSATTATSANTPTTIVLRDGSGNFSAGTITANLNGNATTATSTATATNATNFTGSLVGDVTGTQGATVVSTVGGQTAATVAAGAVLANAATSANTASSIVKRDGSGNFSAGTITANLNGNATTATSTATATNATNFTGSLVGDVTGTQGATVVSTVAGQTAATVAAGAVLANAATSANTASTIVKRDASGNFAAGTITANLSGNATTATTATNFTGSLVGDVTGTQGATVVSTVGGQTAATVAAGAVLANAATSANTASTIVKRDASGNFAAGTITANLNGNATTATSATMATNATNFTGSLVGDVTGTQGATVVSTVGGQTAANVAAGSVLANAATSANTATTVVLRDASGNFSAGTITASLNGNATTATNAITATTATNFTGSLVGDVTGTQGATVVSFVDGQTAAIIAAGAVLANAATSANTATTIVLRDASGNFSAGTITASLSGNATTATTATNFSGSLAGNVTGTQGATVVSTVGGQTAATIAAGAVLANAATNLNTANTIVKRDGSGNFAAGTITAALTGNATTATTATTATNFSGSLAGNVTGTQGATVVSTVGGQTAANVAAATLLANAATNVNTASTIVKRDASGNFIAGTITAALSGNATTATTATNFSGSLAGEVTGTQSATVVSNAVSANTASAIVRRTATGGFTAGSISITDAVLSGNLIVSNSTLTTGNVLKGATTFIHNFGTSNTFVGVNAGNLTTSGTGQNVGIGTSALAANTTGDFNTAVGFSALVANTFGMQNTAIGNNALSSNTTGRVNTAIGDSTLVSLTTGTNNIAIGQGAGAGLSTGSGNIYINANAAGGSETNIIRIGTLQTACAIVGIFGTLTPSGSTVFIGSDGLLGTTTSSRKFKDNIQDMNDASDNIYKLHPVTFIYKEDDTNRQQYGLIAEEVNEIFPELVVRDSNNEPYNVQYHILPVLLLNEVQKQQTTMEHMRDVISSLQQQIQNFLERIELIEARA